MNLFKVIAIELFGGLECVPFCFQYFYFKLLKRITSGCQVPLYKLTREDIIEAFKTELWPSLTNPCKSFSNCDNLFSCGLFPTYYLAHDAAADVFHFNNSEFCFQNSLGRYYPSMKGMMNETILYPYTLAFPEVFDWEHSPTLTDSWKGFGIFNDPTKRLVRPDIIFRKCNPDAPWDMDIVLTPIENKVSKILDNFWNCNKYGANVFDNTSGCVKSTLGNPVASNYLYNEIDVTRSKHYNSFISINYNNFQFVNGLQNVYDSTNPTHKNWWTPITDKFSNTIYNFSCTARNNNDDLFAILALYTSSSSINHDKIYLGESHEIWDGSTPFKIQNLPHIKDKLKNPVTNPKYSYGMFKEGGAFKNGDSSAGTELEYNRLRLRGRSFSNGKGSTLGNATVLSYYIENTSWNSDLLTSSLDLTSALADGANGLATITSEQLDMAFFDSLETGDVVEISFDDTDTPPNGVTNLQQLYVHKDDDVNYIVLFLTSESFIHDTGNDAALAASLDMYTSVEGSSFRMTKTLDNYECNIYPIKYSDEKWVYRNTMPDLYNTIGTEASVKKNLNDLISVKEKELTCHEQLRSAGYLDYSNYLYYFSDNIDTSRLDPQPGSHGLSLESLIPVQDNTDSNKSDNKLAYFVPNYLAFGEGQNEGEYTNDPLNAILLELFGPGKGPRIHCHYGWRILIAAVHMITNAKLCTYSFKQRLTSFTKCKKNRSDIDMYDSFYTSHNSPIVQFIKEIERLAETFDKHTYDLITCNWKKKGDNIHYFESSSLVLTAHAKGGQHINDQLSLGIYDASAGHLLYSDLEAKTGVIKFGEDLFSEVHLPPRLPVQSGLNILNHGTIPKSLNRANARLYQNYSSTNMGVDFALEKIYLDSGPWPISTFKSEKQHKIPDRDPTNGNLIINNAFYTSIAPFSQKQDNFDLTALYAVQSRITNSFSSGDGKTAVKTIDSISTILSPDPTDQPQTIDDDCILKDPCFFQLQPQDIPSQQSSTCT